MIMLINYSDKVLLTIRVCYICDKYKKVDYAFKDLRRKSG